MTFVFAVTAGIGFASVNITDVTVARAARVTPAMTAAQSASNAGITIYTIFFEDLDLESDVAGLMQYIADLTDDHQLQGTYNLPCDSRLISPPPTGQSPQATGKAAQVTGHTRHRI